MTNEKRTTSHTEYYPNTQKKHKFGKKCYFNLTVHLTCTKGTIVALLHIVKFKLSNSFKHTPYLTDLANCFENSELTTAEHVIHQ